MTRLPGSPFHFIMTGIKMSLSFVNLLFLVSFGHNVLVVMYVFSLCSALVLIIELIMLIELIIYGVRTCIINSTRLTHKESVTVLS